VQNYGRLGIVNEIIEETQRLCICLECGKRLGLAGFASFVRRKKIHAQAAFGGIARHATAIYDVWDGPKALINLLQNVQYRGGAIPDCDRYVLELGDIDITGLEGTGRESNAEHR